jgi:splicing factor 3B subunit 1
MNSSKIAQDELKNVLSETAEGEDPLQAAMLQRRIHDSSDSYKNQRLGRMLSPERKDAFNKDDETARSYSQVMKEQEMEKEKQAAQRKINQEKKSEWEEDEAPATKKSRWDKTPSSAWEGTPSRKSRWDQTPVGKSLDATPVGLSGAQTPMPQTPRSEIRLDREMEYRNRYLTDQEYNAMMPTEGYKIIEAPTGYEVPARKLMATPAPFEGGEDGFNMQEDGKMDQ